MARFGQILPDTIQCEMQARAMSLLTEDTKVTLSDLGQDIVMLGAASHLLTSELEYLENRG